MPGAAPTPAEPAFALTLAAADKLDRKLSQLNGICALASAFETYQQDTRPGELRSAMECAQDLIDEVSRELRNLRPVRAKKVD